MRVGAPHAIRANGCGGCTELRVLARDGDSASLPVLVFNMSPGRNPTAGTEASGMMSGGVICVIVEISVAPDDVDRLADDTDKVYAEIFTTVPGFLLGTLAVRREDRRAIGVVYFESAEAWHAAGATIEGVREAMAISPGATFTLTEYDVLVKRTGPAAAELFTGVGKAPAAGAAD